MERENKKLFFLRILMILRHPRWTRDAGMTHAYPELSTKTRGLGRGWGGGRTKKGAWGGCGVRINGRMDGLINDTMDDG